MKIAVLSDIHGNYIALQKCLEHAEAQNIDAYFFLGDYIGEFPYPPKTMKILYDIREKYQCFFIRGNKEDYWINRRKDINCDWKNGNHSIGAMIYCYKNLTSKDIDFFETLPICECIQFDDAAPILLCHGTPENNRGKLLPDDEKTREVVKEYAERYIVCGHTHTQQLILNDEKTVLNAGAVGVPLHGKMKTQYMVLNSDGQEWEYQFISLNYDVDHVIKEIHESGLWDIAPYWCRITEHLLYTGEISHGTVLNEAMRLNGYKDNWYNIEESYWDEALRTLGII